MLAPQGSGPGPAPLVHWYRGARGVQGRHGVGSPQNPRGLGGPGRGEVLQWEFRPRGPVEPVREDTGVRASALVQAAL